MKITTESILGTRWLLQPSALCALLYLLTAWELNAGEKTIRLRQTAIVTQDVDRSGIHRQAAEPAVNGLFLIQLEDNPPADWKLQLEAIGVRTLKYIPDDAWLVKVQQANSATIRHSPFVRHFSRYRPEYKAQAGVAALLTAKAEEFAEVRILLPLGAEPAAAGMVHKKLHAITRLSKSQIGQVIEGRIRVSRLRELIDSEAVAWVELAGKPRLYDAAAAQIVSGEAEPTTTALHQLGFDGRGVTVAVADSGLHGGEGFPEHPDLEDRITGYFYYGALSDASDEHSHGTHVTGIVAGNGILGEGDENGFLYGLGIAPKANIVAQRIFDGLGGYQPPASFAQLTSDAVRLGAEIGSNSWGDDTQGRYDISAMEFDALVRDADPDVAGDQPYILEFSAGNAGAGAQTIGSPAVAKNVIATGASQNNRFDFIIYAEGQETMADFSSRGPCEDGRIKPDVVAPGTWIASLKSSASSDENAWSPISENYLYQGGTSQAGPQVSGAAAVFVQYYRQTHAGATPSPALVKAALINSAVDMDDTEGTDPIPNNDEGWGRIDLTELIGSGRLYHFFDQTNLLKQAETFEHRFVLAAGEDRLRLTLAYTDVPALPAAIPALVNDLDLEVVSPDGAVYRGNQFVGGESIPQAQGRDAINNVEGIHILQPLPGEYVVRVTGRKVVEDARRDSAAVDQDFALVISGDLPLPGQGVIALDRRAYRSPGEMQIKLIDFDLRAQPTVTLQVTSTTENAGLPVALTAASNTGVFTGRVSIARGPALADAAIQANHGDTITVTYQDAAPATTVTAVVRVDLQPPLISNVATTNSFGRQVILWSTDEAANSTVYYSTNDVFTAVNPPLYTTEHEVFLEGLIPGQTYRFYLVSTDEAGNTTTNNNNGALFSFEAAGAATVLLVNAYQHSPDSEAMEIPVEGYTSALDQTGFSYEVWDVRTMGSPKLEDLRPYKVVMWRVNDSFYDSQNTINQTEQTTITSYLREGGAFFMSSMEILSRLGNVPFRTNVLQVTRFVENQDPFSECPECDGDHQVPSIVGAPFEPVADEVDIVLDYGEFPELDLFFTVIGPDLGDVFGHSTNAAPILLNALDEKITGIRSPRAGVDANGRVVFFGFPLEAVPLEGEEPNTRAGLLQRALGFLAPGEGGNQSMAFDQTRYTVPSLVTIEVALGNNAPTPNAPITLSSSSHPQGVPVMLAPTVRPGVYRGSATLGPLVGAASGALPAKDGDLITATYEEASVFLQVHAAIDTVPVTISGRDVQLDYETAIISWETSEPADSLVQFGESPLLGRTAYLGELDFGHELVLNALLPDKEYYYQIVSRDAAGNVTTDDNGGQFHTFRTLKPLTPPWNDNLELGPGEWSVQNGDESEATWELGTPNNVLANTAYSGVNSWGVNLEGRSSSYVQTFLISPAIELSGGNFAKLSFQHNYDFTYDATIEVAQLLLFTNALTQPILLRTYEEFTIDWELEEIDLTPHLGRIVQLVFQYELFDLSFENNVFPGWLLDDFKIEVSNVTRGILQVTNNISSAYVYLDGPQSFEGGGRWFANSNAITGQYEVVWDPVEYYIEPAPRTVTLTGGSPLLIEGNYTFNDVNQNGMSDSWEQEHFGSVSPGRTASTDTDGDGATDLGEFVAGTDPVQSNSKFAVTPPIGIGPNRFRLIWQSVPERIYRVWGSTDGKAWTAYSSWVNATQSTTTSYTLPQLNGSTSYLFKIEVAR